MATYKVAGIGEHRKFFDDGAYVDALNYIANPQKAAYVDGNIASLSTAAQEMEGTAIHFGKNSGKRIRHSILSFDPREHVTPELANQYAQEIIRHYTPEYQIVYAVHTNTDTLHIHLLMCQISYIDGHRYQGKKYDFYLFVRHMQSVIHFPVIAVK